ncbi:MAG: ankyrin repeat domain-containing protein [Wolbachia sp.]
MEVVKVLLDTQEIEVDAKDNTFGATALQLVAQNGHTEIAELLINTKKVNIDTTYKGNFTPLYLASQNEHKAVAKLLLDNGAEVNSYGIALSIAINNGHEKIVELLLSIEGIDVNISNQLGNTLLHVAAVRGL